MNNNTNVSAERGNQQFLSDKDLAQILSVSPSWVRKQRHLRNKGEKHTLEINEVYIGSSPRYLASDLSAWLEGLKS